MGGTVFGKWEIGSSLGKGAFGEVFELTRHDEAFGDERSVMKRIYVQDNKMLERVISEVKLMQKLRKSDYVVEIRAYESERKKDGDGYVVLIHMEYLNTLNTLKMRSGKHAMPAPEAAKLGIHICCALEAAAKHNIIHRDIKPDNILHSDEYGGIYKLGDFGIARAVEEGTGSLTRAGTSGYIAPEVLHFSKYDNRADIYSLGITMYYLLNNNEFPFQDTDKDMYNYRRYLDKERIPAIDGVDKALMSVVLKACEHSPGDRYATAREMREALEAAVRPSANVSKDDLPADAAYINDYTVSDNQYLYYNICSDKIWGIYRGPHLTAGRGKRVLLADCQAVAGTLKADDDWMYFCPTADRSAIHKVSTDGCSRYVIKVSPVKSIENIRITELAVSEGWIYICSSEHGLQKMKTDGSCASLLAHGRPQGAAANDDWPSYSDICVSNNCVYVKQDNNSYIAGTKTIRRSMLQLCKIPVDGSGSIKTYDIKPKQYQISGKWIYYNDFDISAKKYALYKMTDEGTVTEKFPAYINPALFFVCDEWIYYSCYDNNYALYKIRIDGSGKIMLSNDACYRIHVTGDEILYSTRIKETVPLASGSAVAALKIGDLKMIRTDGTDRRCLSIT